MTETEHREPLDLEAIRAELRNAAHLEKRAESPAGELASHLVTMAWVSLGRHVPQLVDTVESLVRQVTQLEHRYEDRREELHRARERLAMATQFTVSLFAVDSIDRHLFDLTVEQRSPGRWAVCRMRDCLGADGRWDFEPSPSNREDDWLEAHRFDLDTALRLAHRAAPDVVVNGVTAREAADRAAAEGGAGNPAVEVQPPPAPTESEAEHG